MSDNEQVEVLRGMMTRPDWDKFQPWLGNAIYEKIINGGMKEVKEEWDRMKARKTNL